MEPPSVTKKSTYADRDATPVEIAVESESASTKKMLKDLAAADNIVEHLPELQGAIFCGHLVADLDSVAGAIGAAELYGGVPARASDINSETKFALEYWGLKLELIRPVEELLEEHGSAARVCLVDFQQTTQLNPAIKESQIVGIIDHHALQSSTIVTQKPIFVDIRPWGSMSSIIAHSFVMLKKALPKQIAGLLLCAILSDTLNLRSPTTTPWDRKVVSMLVQYAGVEDVNLLCAMQFKAKSRSLAAMSAHSLCAGDLKQFKLGKGEKPVRVAFSVVETTDAAAMLERATELVPEVIAVRSSMENCDLMYLAIVDIVELRTHLVVAGEREASLATAAGFNAEPLHPTTRAMCKGAAKHLYLMAPGKVSRKADFIPPLSAAVEDGWTPGDMCGTPSELNLEKLAQESELTVAFTPLSPGGTFVRHKSGGLDSLAVSATPPTTAVNGAA